MAHVFVTNSRVCSLSGQPAADCQCPAHQATAAFNSYAGPEHEVSKQATLASLQTEHKGASKLSAAAMTSSAQQDHNGAADSHYKAAMAHEDAADKTNDPTDKKAHMKAAKLHMDAGHAHRMAGIESAAQPEPDEDDNDMTTNALANLLAPYPQLITNGRIVNPYGGAVVSLDNDLLPLPSSNTPITINGRVQRHQLDDDSPLPLPTMNLSGEHSYDTTGGTARGVTTPAQGQYDLPRRMVQGAPEGSGNASELFGMDDNNDKDRANRRRQGLPDTDDDVLHVPTSMADILGQPPGNSPYGA